MNYDHFPDLPRGLVYLDHAATSMKPQVVIDRMHHFLASENASPHRGAYALSVQATHYYGQSKSYIKEFLRAPKDWEVVYTKNATESFNLLALGLPSGLLSPNDAIAIVISSHHSNLLPWQRLSKLTGAQLRYLYVDSEGQLLEEAYAAIDAATKLVIYPLISNALGTLLDVNRLTRLAKTHGALVVADGAQAVGHIPVDLEALQMDYFVFSGHKVYGPTGIGVLMASKAHLESLEPLMVGGDMIEYVTESGATFAPVPQRLEGGTQNVVGALGLMRALQWLDEVGLEKVYEHEHALTAYLYKRLAEREDVSVYGPEKLKDRGALVAFNLKGVHPHDVASILDQEGIAIRAGHHCCQPLMHYLKIPATCRASIGYYNTPADVDALVSALDRVREVFPYDATTDIF